MFGFCHNKEIIHQHHHHFYQIVVDQLKSREFTHKIASKQPQEINNNFDRMDIDQRIEGSKLYSLKSRYEQKRQKGIHLSFKEENSDNMNNIMQNNAEGIHHNQQLKFLKNIPSQISKPNIQLSNNLITQKDVKHKNHLYLIDNYRQINYLNSQNNKLPDNLMAPKNIKHKKHQGFTDNQRQTSHMNSKNDICNNFSQLIKSAELMPQSKATSLTQTTKRFKNSHQLINSKINIKSQPNKNVQKSKSFHHPVLPKQKKKLQKQNLSLNYQSLPSNKPISDDIIMNSKYSINSKDIVLTQKVRQQRIIQKKISLYDDAKSIISDQNDLTKSINIQESFILNHQIDYFQAINEEIHYHYNTMSLAIDKNIGILVSLKIFQIQNQPMSHHQLQILSMIEITKNKELKNYVIELYKVLTDGSGFNRNIIFINEPYQTILDGFIIKNRQFMKRNHLYYYEFMKEFQYQIKHLLSAISQSNFYLNSALNLSDFIIINNRYKLHSIYKLSPSSQKSHLKFNHLQLLKTQITIKLNQIVKNLVQ